MGTASIVILWYGFLALALMVLSKENSSTMTLAAGIFAVLFLLFSFFSHRRHSKHKLFLMIVLPLMLMGIGSFVAEDSDVYVPLPSPPPFNWVPPAQVELQDLQLKHSFFIDRVSGSLRNNSNSVVHDAVLRLRLISPQGKQEIQTINLRDLNVAPAGTQKFEQTLLGFHARKGSGWTWELQLLGAAG